MKKYFAELVGTFVLTFLGCGAAVALGCGTDAVSVVGTAVAFGLSLVLIHLVGIHFTGTSVNPARSIGPALFAGGDNLAQLWVFIVGPLVGGALAAGIWKAVEPDEV